MKLKFVVTHIIRQTEIPALLDSSGYKHALCQNAVSTTKLKIKFRKTVTRLSVGLSVTFFLSLVKLCIGGLRKIAVSWAICYL
jgi:hypothetical protein